MAQTRKPARPPRTAAEPAAEVAPTFSIEELAARSGLTVRNLREFQARGLLAPPELRGRKGFYTLQHLGRVGLIRKLQERGYSLAGIADLLKGWEQGAGISEVLGLERAVLTPAVSARQQLTRKELLARLPELKSAPLLARARAVGLVAGEGAALRAPDAELVEIARKFLDIGYPMEAVLEELALMREDAARIAARARALFQRYYLGPLLTKDLPPAKLAELSDTVRALRPAAARAFMLVLGAAIEGESSGPSGRPKPG